MTYSKAYKYLKQGAYLCQECFQHKQYVQYIAIPDHVTMYGQTAYRRIPITFDFFGKLHKKYPVELLNHVRVYQLKYSLISVFWI